MARITFTCDDELEIAIAKAAEKDGRKISPYIARTMTRAVSQEGFPVKGEIDVMSQLEAAAKQIRGGPEKLLAVAREMMRPKRRSA